MSWLEALKRMDADRFYRRKAPPELTPMEDIMMNREDNGRCLYGLYMLTYCTKAAEIRMPNGGGAGIMNKIRLQIRELSRLGPIALYNPMYKQASDMDRLLKECHLYDDRFVLSGVDWMKVDYLYIRRPQIFSQTFADFLAAIKEKKPGIVIVLEIPTYPYDDEFNGQDWRAFQIIDACGRAQLGRAVDVIATYSADKEIFGLPTLNLSNGVDCSYYRQFGRGQDYGHHRGVHMVACAQFTYWHGYDRLINGVGDYLHRHPDAELTVHLIGAGPELVNYKQLVAHRHLDKYVVFEGVVLGENLARLYQGMDIAFDSLGRHRSGVFYNSSLKGKEYCANGLPIVSGVITELDADKDYPYYFRVPANDEPVDLEAVLDFCRGCAGQGRERMRAEIMAYAQRHFDIREAFRPVLDFIRERVGRTGRQSYVANGGRNLEPIEKELVKALDEIRKLRATKAKNELELARLHEVSGGRNDGWGSLPVRHSALVRPRAIWSAEAWISGKWRKAMLPHILPGDFLVSASSSWQGRMLDGLPVCSPQMLMDSEVKPLVVLLNKDTVQISSKLIQAGYKNGQDIFEAAQLLPPPGAAVASSCTRWKYRAYWLPGRRSGKTAGSREDGRNRWPGGGRFACSRGMAL